MTAEALTKILKDVSGYSDFTVVLKKEFNEKKWGAYFYIRSAIQLYVLDKKGKEYPDTIIILEGLHELTHHVLYNYLKVSMDGNSAHDYNFKNLFVSYVQTYYNGKVPQFAKAHLKEGGYWIG